MAVAAVWALEAFAYTLFTALAITAVLVAVEPAGSRRRAATRGIGWIVGACVAGHVVFALATLLASGSLPDWPWYFQTLRDFLVGGLADLTYDFASYSSAFPIAGLYVASASALALIVWRRPDVLPRQRTLLVALTGTTAWGIALFTYLVNRGLDHIIAFCALPAVALVALWLSFLGQRELAVSRPARRTALAGVLVVAAWIVAASWSWVEVRYPQSALAYAVPGGESLPDALDKVRRPPPMRAEMIEGRRLLRQFMPDEDRSIVLADADLVIEILMRSNRGAGCRSAIPGRTRSCPTATSKGSASSSTSSRSATGCCSTPVVGSPSTATGSAPISIPWSPPPSRGWCPRGSHPCRSGCCGKSASGSTSDPCTRETAGSKWWRWSPPAG
ncbi:MAG: hypothetical protein R2695_13795 [Acidimicrobiales bacterium]